MSVVGFQKSLTNFAVELYIFQLVLFVSGSRYDQRLPLPMIGNHRYLAGAKRGSNSSPPRGGYLRMGVVACWLRCHDLNHVKAIASSWLLPRADVFPAAIPDGACC